MKTNRRQKPYKAILLVVLAVLVLLVLAFAVFRQKASAPAPKTAQVPSKTQTSAKSFDTKQYSIDDPASLWIIVNKQRPLPSTYAPPDLAVIGGEQMRAEAAAATNALILAASQQGVPLKVISGYRSYASQASVYSNYARSDGQAKADTYSARPGHSEHQTGWAADLGSSSGACDLEICFASSPGGQWLAAHAHEYGFIIRYKQGQESLSGYQYEPWHIRYVGRELAAQLQENNQTMEQFFGLPASPTY